MSVQVLPAEMCDLFVDQLGLAIEDPESRSALLACSLVNKVFYRRASSHIFSSISISIAHSQKRLDDLCDVLNANPDIARYIRSITVEAQSRSEIHCESLQGVLRQLPLLQKFGWIYQLQLYSQFLLDMHNPHYTMMRYLVDRPSLTTFHLKNVLRLSLSLFSGFNHLKSLSLVNVGFSKTRVDVLSGPLFSSLERLEITGAFWSEDDVEAVKAIMVRAAPTLNSLVLLKKVFMYSRFFLNLNPTVFPVLESIQLSCLIFPRSNNAIPPVVCQLLDYSAPMVKQIEIEFEWTYFKADQPFIFSLVNGWLLLDEILSGPNFPSLKTLQFTFSSKSPLPDRCLEMDLGRNAVGKFLKERLPCVSSCSRHIEIDFAVSVNTV